MAFGCAAGALLAATRVGGPGMRRVEWAGAAGAVQLRLLCNLLDGMVAVRMGRATRTGELFNEIPDRVSDAATLIGAGYAAGGLPVLGFVAACLALFTAYIRAVGKAGGAKQEYCGPMAKQQRMFVVTVAAVYCAIAPVRWQPEIGIGRAGIMSAALAVIIVGCVVTAARRLRRIYRQLETPR
jgi:phosphatidylglycerophosphate synthase